MCVTHSFQYLPSTMTENNTVDKFGRMRIPKARVLARYGIAGFNLTSDNNYDIQGKRLCNVAEPRELNDVTTRKYVDLRFRNYRDILLEECKKLEISLHNYINEKDKEIINAREQHFKVLYDEITALENKLKVVISNQEAAVTEKMVENYMKLSRQLDQLDKKVHLITDVMNAYGLTARGMN